MNEKKNCKVIMLLKIYLLIVHHIVLIKQGNKYILKVSSYEKYPCTLNNQTS